MDEDCEHGMGDPAWCVICNGRARRERKEQELAAEMGRNRWRFAKLANQRGVRSDRWDSHPIDDRLLVRGGLIDEFGTGKAQVKR